MALFRRSDLRRHAVEDGLRKSVVESNFVRLANSTRSFDSFLSHSYLDATEVAALSNEIEKMEFTVYVDWKVDQQLDRSKVTKETAELLRSRMRRCRTLFFATSQHSQSSKWMPWELGFFDGIKSKVAVLPVVDDTIAASEKYVGQEYLQLYPYVTVSHDTKNERTLWVHDSPARYVRFSKWLEGKAPYDHD